MKKYIKCIALATLSGLAATTAIVTPIAILSQNDYSVKLVKETEKKQQIETFKEVSEYEIADSIDSIISDSMNFELYSSDFDNTESSENKDMYEKGINNIIEHKTEIIELSNQVKNGDILISDIQKKQQEYIENNPEEYHKLINGFNNEQPTEEYSVLTYSSINHNYSIQNFNNIDEPEIKTINGQQCLVMTKQQFSYLQNLIDAEKQINRLNKLNSIVLKSSIALNVVAYGVAAFYWGAWWMFGGNIPFAIAATTQAVTLTFFNIISSIDFNKVFGYVDEQFLTAGNKDLANLDLKKPNQYIQLANNSIAFILRNIPKVITKKIFSILYKRASYQIIENTAEYIFRFFKKGVREMAAKNTILVGTSWANPIISFISTISSVLSIMSLVISVFTIILQII